MWNKAILPEVANKVNHYSRFMIVFDYDKNKEWQKCFSYSSPKEKGRDLRYYYLPNDQRIALNSVVDIPTKYLKVANFEKMKNKEYNWQVKKNIEHNIINLNMVKKYQTEILEQYDVILRNIQDNHKFSPEAVRWSHERMIDDRKQHEFCMKEIKLIKQQELLLTKEKQNDGGGSSGTSTNTNKTGAEIWKEYEDKQKALLKQNNHLNRLDSQSENKNEHEQSMEEK